MTKTELNNQHLDWLEAESIHIIREVVAECENPALLFSGGKDSVVLLALARKAFQLGDRPVHSDGEPIYLQKDVSFSLEPETLKIIT